MASSRQRERLPRAGFFLTYAMNAIPPRLLALSLLCAAVVPAAADAPKTTLEKLYPGLAVERPISVQIPDDGTKRRFLVEQTGRIKILPADEKATEAKVFLDMTKSMGWRRISRRASSGSPSIRSTRKTDVSTSPSPARGPSASSSPNTPSRRAIPIPPIPRASGFSSRSRSRSGITTRAISSSVRRMACSTSAPATAD